MLLAVELLGLSSALSAPLLDCVDFLLNPNSTEYHALQAGVHTESERQFLAVYAQVQQIYPEISLLVPPQNLIYVLDHYRTDQIQRLTDLLAAAAAELQSRMQTQGIQKTFISAMFDLDPGQTAMVLDLQIAVAKLKTQHKVAKAVSDSAHGQQEYSKGLSYGYHLRQVRRVLKFFGHGPKNSLLGLVLGTAARLHDILEDTNVDPLVLRQLFGEDVISIVERVTNEPRPPGLNQQNESAADKAARKFRTYQKIAQDPRAVILKLADRIANTLESKYALYYKPGDKNVWKKYKNEWDGGLKNALGTPPGTEKMWAYLERLMTDPTFIPNPADFDTL